MSLQLRSAIFLALTLAGACTPAPAMAAARVEMELVTESGIDPTAPQRWYQVLTSAGISDLRIRGAEGRDRVTVETQGTPANRVYRVTAVLTTNNQVLVPGHQFRSTDAAGIAHWVERLRTAGPEVAGSSTRLPFDLAPEMLATAQELLRPALTERTQELDAIQALRPIHDALGGRIRMTTATRDALREAGPVVDELQGLSLGTALAVLLRPAGLAFAPQRSSQGELQFTAFAPGSDAEIWPVGWPAEDRRRELAPKLFEFLNVEIGGVSVAKAVEVIGARLEAPILYDHVALAAHGIDPENVQAALPAKRTSYSLALQRVLRQAGLKIELRVDDAGRPFFWVSTVKPV